MHNLRFSTVSKTLNRRQKRREKLKSSKNLLGKSLVLLLFHSKRRRSCYSTPSQLVLWNYCIYLPGKWLRRTPSAYLSKNEDFLNSLLLPRRIFLFSFSRRFSSSSSASPPPDPRRDEMLYVQQQLSEEWHNRNNNLSCRWFISRRNRIDDSR